jgi:L-fucose mutarotase
MLRTSLTHPEILRALATAGHGSQVLISDGNFPHSTAPYPGAARVFLNLTPGRLTVAEVLEAVLTVLPIEAAALMDPADGSLPPRAHQALTALLPGDTQVEHIPRFDFYAATASDRLALVIATGDLRPYANVLLTIGVIPA